MKFTERFKKVLKSRKFWLALGVITLSFLSTYLASDYLANKYGGSLPIIKADFFLSRLPYLDIAWIYDSLAVIITIIFIFYVIKYDLENGPYFILLFGFYHLIRSIFIVLTPFGVPNGGSSGAIEGVISLFGEYPSGHLGSAVLSFLLIGSKYKRLILILGIFLAAALLLGRGHYSIDLFSAVIFAYAVYCFGEKNLKKRMHVKH